MDDQHLNPGRGKEGILLFIAMYRLALGLTQSPIHWVLGALSPGLNQLGCEANHSPPYSTEVKNTWRYTSTPPYIFMA